jgi:hypothetical protein
MHYALKLDDDNSPRNRGTTALWHKAWAGLMMTVHHQCCQCRMSKIPPYKCGIVIYGTTMSGGVTQISYGRWHKIRHAILPWLYALLLFNNTALHYLVAAYNKTYRQKETSKLGHVKS